MTVEKPEGMSWTGFVEQQIEQARREGAFDDLPYRGQPLPVLEQPYDENWWVKRYMEREDLSFLPETMQLKLDVEQALEKMDRSPSRKAVLARMAEINARIREVNRRALDGPASSTAELSPSSVLARWEAARAARVARTVSAPSRAVETDRQARVAAALLLTLTLGSAALVWLAVG